MVTGARVESNNHQGPSDAGFTGGNAFLGGSLYQLVALTERAEQKPQASAVFPDMEGSFQRVCGTLYPDTPQNFSAFTASDGLGLSDEALFRGRLETFKNHQYADLVGSGLVETTTNNFARVLGEQRSANFRDAHAKKASETTRLVMLLNMLEQIRRQIEELDRQIAEIYEKRNEVRDQIRSLMAQIDREEGQLAERYGSDWKQHWKEHQDDPLVQAWLRDKARLDDLRTQDNGLTTELHKLQRERDDLQQQSDSIEGQIKVQQARADRGDLEAAAKVEALKREGMW